MKLLFKQRFFSWFDSYDIYGEGGETLFTVEGKLAFGHKLEIYDPAGGYLGQVRQEVLTFLPRFRMYLGDSYIGQIKKEFTLFRPVFTLDCNGWEVQGDLFEWEYTVVDGLGNVVMTASKELFHFSDTYVIDVPNAANALLALMIVLAIDAAKCSSGN